MNHTTKHTFTTHGLLTTCTCGWEKLTRTQTNADKAAHDHKTKHTRSNP